MIDATEQVRRQVDEVYQTESRRVFATLIRLLGDFDLAEDALHDAFAAALKQWAKDGVPANPRAWLVSTGRFKAIDGIRRRARFDASLATLAAQIDDNTEDEEEWDDEGVGDDRLRLIFTCCHPALSLGCAGRADAARGLRTHYRGDRARIPDRSAHAGAAHRARQGEDSRRGHSVPGAGAGRPAGAVGRRAAGDLPRVQRGVLRLVGRIADARRSLG